MKSNKRNKSAFFAKLNYHKKWKERDLVCARANMHKITEEETTMKHKINWKQTAGRSTKWRDGDLFVAFCRVSRGGRLDIDVKSSRGIDHVLWDTVSATMAAKNANSAFCELDSW